MRVTVTYDRLTHRAQRNFTCRECGKPGRKAKTFGQTLNPFNKNADGTLKTRAEIMAELHDEGARWDPEPIHDRCRTDDDWCWS